VTYGIRSLHGGSVAELAKAWHAPGSSVKDIAERAITAPAAELNQLRRYYEDAYYGWVHNTIRAIDPNHMVVAAWVSIGWWAEEEDWDIAARHCEVVGYDRYSRAPSDPAMAARLARVDKPVLLGEFSFPPNYAGGRGLGAYPWAWATDDTEAGALYAAQVKASAVEPHTIGALWFEYRDEPVTGRGPGSGPQLVYGEDFAFGMVDGTDQPKWGLVEQVRAANLTLTSLRGAATAAK
jgi:hypothetical protein